MLVVLLMAFASAFVVIFLAIWSMGMPFHSDRPGAWVIWALLASVAWLLGHEAARRLNRLRPFKGGEVLWVGAVVLAGFFLACWVWVLRTL